MTYEERVKLVANLLAMNRRNVMAGRPAQFNNEALLVILTAPEWFLEAQAQGMSVLCPMQNELSQLWLEVQFDIDRMFPGQFDWDRKAMNPNRGLSPDGVADLLAPQ